MKQKLTKKKLKELYKVFKYYLEGNGHPDETQTDKHGTDQEPEQETHPGTKGTTKGV